MPIKYWQGEIDSTRPLHGHLFFLWSRTGLKSIERRRPFNGLPSPSNGLFSFRSPISLQDHFFSMVFPWTASGRRSHWETIEKRVTRGLKILRCEGSRAAARWRKTGPSLPPLSVCHAAAQLTRTLHVLSESSYASTLPTCSPAPALGGVRASACGAERMQHAALTAAIFPQGPEKPYSHGSR